MMKLKAEQIDEVVRWMNTWEQLKDTAIPIRFKEYYSEQLHKPDVMESVLPLLRECVMRSNLALPENEQDLKWFDETCSVKNSGDFYERLHAALELGGKTAP